MLKIQRLAAPTLAVAVALSIGGCSTGEESPALEKIVITAIPTQDDLTMQDRFDHLANLISEVTGLPVEYFDAPDYAAMTEALASGRAQIAHMDAFSYVSSMKRVPGLELLAGSARSSDDTPGYLSYGITMLDSDIYSLEDLRGKTICYSDPASTGSYLWPKVEMEKVGIDGNPLTSEDISGIYTGSITSVAVGVFNQDCDAGFITDGTFLYTLPSQGIVDTSQLRVFWESVEIPGVPLVAHPSIPADMRAKIKEVVLERANKDWMVENGLCDSTAECKYLSPAAWGYVTYSDANYDVMREFCREAGIAECE